MEQNDLALIKAENDRLTTDIEKLKQRLREEITRTQAGVRLDLNLEKGRMREEASGQELKIKEVDTRIEQEIANLRTNIQSSKATTLQYLVGFGELGPIFVMTIFYALCYLRRGFDADCVVYFLFRQWLVVLPSLWRTSDSESKDDGDIIWDFLASFRLSRISASMKGSSPAYHHLKWIPYHILWTLDLIDRHIVTHTSNH